MISNEFLLIALMVVILLVILFVYRPWRVKRAAYQVIDLFRAHNATTAKNALTLEELRISTPNILEAGFRFKDYKKDALDIMVRKGIIQTTDEFKFYLSEQTLLRSNLYKPQSYPR